MQGRVCVQPVSASVWGKMFSCWFWSRRTLEGWNHSGLRWPWAGAGLHQAGTPCPWLSLPLEPPGPPALWSLPSPPPHASLDQPCVQPWPGSPDARITLSRPGSHASSNQAWNEGCKGPSRDGPLGPGFQAAEHKVRSTETALKAREGSFLISSKPGSTSLLSPSPPGHREPNNVVPQHRSSTV